MFPYYIVRFKPRYTQLAPPETSRFPYYIVRFKRKTSFCLRSVFFQFPYYIVRFKPILPVFACVSFFCFHTTQCDLNYFILFYFILFYFILFYFILFYFYAFPYYIVRFKQIINFKLGLLPGFHTTQCDLNKSFYGSTISTCPARFHTTQCDLNFLLMSLRIMLDIWKFPYYIVRFKPKHLFLLLLLFLCFHTTQCDLNEQIVFFDFWTKKVSILHSAI